MDVFVSRPKKYNQWNNHYISPGPVGPIGDVLPNVRYQNSESLPMRFKYRGNQLSRLGQNVCDGDWYSESTGGLATPALVDDFYSHSTRQQLQSRWDTQAAFRDSQEVGNPDVRIVNRGDESWRIANIQARNSLATGRLFTPLPGGYPPRGIPRGVGPQSSFIVGTDTLNYLGNTGLVTPAVGRPNLGGGVATPGAPIVPNAGPACPIKNV